MKLVNALGKSRKKSMKEEKANLTMLSIYDHHLIKNSQCFPFNKLSIRELYNTNIIKNSEKRTSQSYYDSLFCAT